MDTNAGDVLNSLVATLKAAGAEVSRVNGGPDSAFAHMTIRLPNGQVFKIQAEETY